MKNKLNYDDIFGFGENIFGLSLDLLFEDNPNKMKQGNTDCTKY